MGIFKIQLCQRHQVALLEFSWISPLMIWMLLELKSIYLRTHQRLLRISGPCAQVKKECHKRQERICISRIASSIELSQDSWPKVGISPTSMELAENQFMEKSLQMK